MWLSTLSPSMSEVPMSLYEGALPGGASGHLFLFVKVRENWADDPERYREWGLDFGV